MTPTNRPSLARQVAAIVTMVLLVFGAVALTVFLIGNLGYLLLAWVGLLGGSIAVAEALQSSGVARRLWLVLVVVSVALIVLAILGAGSDTPLLLATVVLVGIAVAVLGRFALGEPPPARAPLQAHHPAMLVNPKSGDGKAERTGLVAEAEKRGISVRVLEKDDDLTELARAAIADGADVIGMAGGDGSLGYVAAAAIEADVPFVAVPTGTRNHFARDLGLDRNDVIAALDGFSGDVVTVDYATVNGRVFLNNASLGLYGKIVSDPAYRESKAETSIAAMQELSTSGASFDLRYATPDGRPHDVADLIFVGNNPYVVSGPLNDLGKRERLDAGFLGVLTLTITSTKDFARLLSLAATGRSIRFSGWDQWTAETFRVKSGSAVSIGIDGESVSMDPPLDFAIHRKRRKVAVPRGTTVGAAAGLLSSQAKVSDLWRVARGRGGA